LREYRSAAYASELTSVIDRAALRIKRLREHAAMLHLPDLISMEDTRPRNGVMVRRGLLPSRTGE
jgi:hypothetical protein